MEMEGALGVLEMRFSKGRTTCLPWCWTQKRVPPLEPCLCLFGLQEPDETALHLAVRSVDRTSLHIVDFLVQNRWVFCDQGGPWIVFLGVSEEGARGLVAAVVWPGCWGLRRCADAFPDRRRLPGVGGARAGSPSSPGV